PSAWRPSAVGKSREGLALSKRPNRAHQKLSAAPETTGPRRHAAEKERLGNSKTHQVGITDRPLAAISGRHRSSRHIRCSTISALEPSRGETTVCPGIGEELRRAAR